MAQTSQINFFVWCVFNSYVIQDCYKPHKQPGQRVHTFRVFIDELCHDLLWAQRRTPTPKSTCKSVLNETRLQNEALLPLPLPERPQGATSNNRCVVCFEKYYKTKRAQPEARDSDLPKRRKTVY